MTRIDSIRLHKQSQLMADYRDQKNAISQFFDYNPFISYEQRIMDLKKRDFDREHLTDVLKTLNQEWNAPVSTFENIKRLQRDDSVVVIGGQQAGLLTGPIYTINKIISIIQFAKQQEKKLSIPVIPVFWIAGEDHDFEEINHIYLPEEGQMKKHKFKTQLINKTSVSHLPIDKSACSEWIDQLFTDLKETKYTKTLYDRIINCLEQSESYTDFFANLLFQLFEEEGLVLIDSAHPEVRKLEKFHFIQLIKNQPEISEGVYTASEELKQKGYALTLESEINNSNLFYHKDNERILLIRDEEGNWKGKQGEVILSTDELLEIAENQPELLSNNVVSRPLMQELLFPSLSFIAGPGEISYWAALKPAFHTLNMQMPPVLPRLSITFVDRHTEKLLSTFNLNVEQTVNGGLADFKETWLSSKITPPISELAEEMKATVMKAHEPLRTLAKEMRADLGELADKNLAYLYRDVDFLENRLSKALEEKYARELSELAYMDMILQPMGGLQERIWNPLSWLNDYGLQWLKNITDSNLSFKEEHYIICL